MSVPSYPFHSLLLKFPNKRMDFPFPLLKLPNKRREEYSKIIIFINSHSIPFHFLLPNEGLGWCYFKPRLFLYGSHVAQLGILCHLMFLLWHDNDMFLFQIGCQLIILRASSYNLNGT